MAGKNMSGKYGCTRGGNYGPSAGGQPGSNKEPGCFGVVALLFVSLGALAGLIAAAAQYVA